MSWLKRLFGITPQPVPQEHSPRGGLVYLFHGTFESEIAATDHALQDLPKALGRRLTGDDVEIVHGSRVPHALPMISPRPAIADSNTLILVSADGPEGLQDTDRLSYCGQINIR